MITSLVPVLPLMAEQPKQPDDTPSSETVRIATDLKEMLREMAFFQRDDRGKRINLTQLIDNLLRGPVTEAYARFKAEQQAQGKPKGKKDS